jgi:hypothetical protein
MAVDKTVRIFLERADLAATAGIVELFHAVRRIPYGVTGDRTARGVVERWCGSCSGKHVLLSTVLGHFGYTSRIVTVETTVDRGLPENSRVSTRILELAKINVTPDFHHFAQCLYEGDWIDLDATWDDSLESCGFPVNRSWCGTSKTHIAFTPIRVVGYSSPEDLPALKTRLLGELSASQRENRREFFRELTGWLSEQVRSELNTPTSGALATGRKSSADGCRRW